MPIKYKRAQLKVIKMTLGHETDHHKLGFSVDLYKDQF